MTSLVSRHSNWQVYGFFGLFLANTIWTFYVLVLLKAVSSQRDVVDYFYEVVPILGIHVTIPLVTSFLISYKMHLSKMITKSNYSVLLLAGFLISFIFVVSGYFY